MDFSKGGRLIMSQPNGLLILGDHLFLNYNFGGGQWWLINRRGLLILTWHYMAYAKSHGSPYPPAISLSKVDHQCWWRAWVSPFRKNAGIPSGSVALACLMIPESSSRWWARRRYRFLNPFKLLRTMSANKPDVCSMAILGSLYLNWRYLPCIRPM